MVSSLTNLDARGEEALQAAIREAAENSARGLSTMVDQRIDLVDARVETKPVWSLHSLFGEPGVEVVAILLGITGDIEGHIALALSTGAAADLVEMLCGEGYGLGADLDPMAQSALGEVGNLVGSFFLNVLADASGLLMMPTPPTVIVDMGGAILDAVLAMLWGEGEQVMTVEGQFFCGNRSVKANLLVLPSCASVGKVIGALSK